MPKEAPAADPWGGSANGNTAGNDWAQFDQNKTSSPFGTTAEWPQTTTGKHGEILTSDAIQYQVLYDYAGERPDELSISAGDIVIVSEKQILFFQDLIIILFIRSGGSH